MSRKKQRILPWSFMVGETRIDVHQRSKHVAYTVNRETGRIGESVEVYEATITEPDGRTHDSPIPLATFRQLRKYADDPESNVRTVEP